MISICTYNEVGISVKEGRKVYLKRGKKKKEGERKIKHKIRRERQTAKGGRENTVQKGSRSIYVAREKERGGSMLRRNGGERERNSLTVLEGCRILILGAS